MKKKKVYLKQTRKKQNKNTTLPPHKAQLSSLTERKCSGLLATYYAMEELFPGLLIGEEYYHCHHHPDFSKIASSCFTFDLRDGDQKPLTFVVKYRPA